MEDIDSMEDTIPEVAPIEEATFTEEVTLMEEAAPVYEYDLEPPETKPKMSPWLIVLLVVLAACCVLVLAPICIIAILTLLGPSIGNVFSNIVMGI